MASPRATTIAQGFSNKLMKEVYDMSLIDTIVNRDYEGEINGVGSQLNILNIERVTEKNYAGVALTPDSLFENNSKLIIDKYKSFYWQEKTLDNWLSFIKDPKPAVITQTAEERNKNMDTHVLGFYGDVGAGNRVGTDYTTGDVQVVTGTGAVIGNGTTFTAAMVGRGFKATGHTKWYRVATFTDATHITIEDDLDDVTSAYTGGAINAGATYIIEAATPLAVTTSNLLQTVGKLRLKLDSAEKEGHNAVPLNGRWLIVPPEFQYLLPRASGVALHVPEAYQELVKKGMITMLDGFMVFVSNRLTGDNTNGYRVLAGHSNWMTFAEKVLQVKMEEDLPGDFGTAYKDLFVYGAKVADKRRHQAAEAYVTFTL